MGRSRSDLLVFGWLLTVLASDSNAGPIFPHLVINNGLSPPSASNVIGPDTNIPGPTQLWVRNVSCGDVQYDEYPCAAPGDPTAVEVIEGATLGGAAIITENSSITFSGGSLLSVLTAFDQSHVSIQGGVFPFYMQSFGDSVVSMTGGAVSCVLVREHSHFSMSGGIFLPDPACGSSFFLVLEEGATAVIDHGSMGLGSALPMNVGHGHLTIVGRDFALDGIPVGGGAIDATTGTLAGRLASGNPFSVTFERGLFGTLELVVQPVPEPSISLLVMLGMVMLSSRRGGLSKRHRAPPPRRCHEERMPRLGM